MARKIVRRVRKRVASRTVWGKGSSHRMVSVKGWDKARDSQRRAKPAGKRKSKRGNTYYEARVNRADATFGSWRRKHL